MRRALWALPALLLLAGCRPNAVWSPDGKLLALEPKGQLFTFNTQTRQFRYLPRGHRYVVCPTWSPNGSSITYYGLTRKGEETTGIDLMSADAATGISKPLIPRLPLVKAKPDALDIGTPLELVRETLSVSWKPDGTQFAYLAFEGADTTLWVANADGSSRKALLTSGLRNAYAPAWSPDGSRIAFISVAPTRVKVPAPDQELAAPGELGGSLEVVNPDGSGRKMLWDGSTREALTPFGPPLVWSPDSKSVYVTVGREMKQKEQFPEKCELYSVPADGSEPKSHGLLDGPPPFLNFNPNGAIFFLAPATETEMYPRIGFAPALFGTTNLLGALDHQVLGLPEGAQMDTDTFPIPSISPDGSRFAVSFVPKTGKPTLLLRSTAADGKWEKFPVPLMTAAPAKTAARKPAAKKPAPKRRRSRR